MFNGLSKMQRFYELSDKEVRELTDDQMQDWINIECAHEGAPMLPPVPPEPVRPSEMQPDTVYYRVVSDDASWSASAVATFTDEADAIGLVAAMRGLKSLGMSKSTAANSDYQVVSESPPELTVKRLEGFTEAHNDAIASLAHEYGEKKNVYDEARAARDKAAKARDAVASSLWRRWHETRDQHIRNEHKRVEFGEYMEIAGNDRSMAYAFLLKAHPDFPEDYPELHKEFDPSAIESDE